MFSSTVKTFGSFETMHKQIRFATAVALTKTAQQAQAASIDSIAKTFSIRNNWSQPGNKFGIRIKPAKKDNLEAQVTTFANWLKLHEEESTKLPSKKFIAIPTVNVRRNKKDIITKGNRPNALRGKNTFVIDTKNGPVIFQRKGKGKREKLIALYILKPKAHIKKQSTFYEPIGRIARANFDRNFTEAVKNAFATTK